MLRTVEPETLFLARFSWIVVERFEADGRVAQIAGLTSSGGTTTPARGESVAVMGGAVTTA